MKRTLIILGLLLCSIIPGFAQRVTNGNYQTVAYIKSDGTVQDGNYRTIGHADGIPMKWAAFYFFFSK